MRALQVRQLASQTVYRPADVFGGSIADVDLACHRVACKPTKPARTLLIALLVQPARLPSGIAEASGFAGFR